jgi:hypothetical protein
MEKQLLTYLYLLGQVLEISGAYLIFHYGLPPFIERIPITRFDYSGLEPEKIKADEEYQKFNRIGFRLIMFGFIAGLPLNIFNCVDVGQSNNDSGEHTHSKRQHHHRCK